MAHIREIMAAGVYSSLARMLGSNALHVVDAAGGGQEGATPLIANFCVLQTSGPDQGVRLGYASAAALTGLYNDGPDALALYPAEDEAFINTAAVDAPLTLPADAAVLLVPSVDQWLALATGAQGTIGSGELAPGVYVEATGAPMALGEMAATNLVSLALQRGDWIVNGSAYFDTGMALNYRFLLGAHTVSGALPPAPHYTQISPEGVTSGQEWGLAIPERRFYLSVPATIYLVAQVGSGAGATVTASGHINARSLQSVVYGGEISPNEPITLSGDASGTGTTGIPTIVTALQGRPVSATVPAAAEVLTWNGSVWEPTPAPAGGGTGAPPGGVTGAVQINAGGGNFGGVTMSGDATWNTSTGALTLATVNSNVGTFQGITVNGKGLVTAASSQSYLTVASAAATYAPLASPTFTGDPQAPTPLLADRDTSIATTSFVRNREDEIVGWVGTNYAPNNNPVFTGNPVAPTPAPGDSDTSIATTAFVAAAVTAAPNKTITLSGDTTGSGTSAITTTLANNAVVDAKLRQGGALTVIGRSANTTGNVADIAGTANQVLRVSGASVLGFGAIDLSQAASATGVTQAASEPAHTGDVTNTAGSLALTIANSAVTYAKMQNVAAARLLGNPTGSAAAPSEISLGTNLNFTGTVLNATVAAGGMSGMTAGQIPIAATATTVTSSANLSGDVVSTATTLATTIQANAVTTTKIINSAVTYAKIQNVANNRILGNTSGSAAAPSEIVLPLSAANGGTGLASGTSGGIPYYNSTTTLASSALLTVNALIKGGGAGLPPVASTATVDGSGNLTATGSLTVNGNANPVLGVASGYTNLFAPDATTNNRGVFLGNAANVSNYYRNTKHDFQDGSYTQLARIDAGGFYLSGNANPALSIFAAQFTALFAPDSTSASGAIILGVAANPKNQHSNTTHEFFDRAVTTKFAQFDSSGLTLVGNLTVTSIVANGNVNPFNGYVGRAGNGGASANNFNIYWTGSAAQLWIDTVNTGNISITSDYRIKENVTGLPSMWDRVKGLRAVSYTIKDHGVIKADPAERWGFLAHELQETLLDSAATGHKDAPNLVQSPDVMTVVASLTKALQEAMARIELLEAALP